VWDCEVNKRGGFIVTCLPVMREDPMYCIRLGIASLRTVSYYIVLEYEGSEPECNLEIIHM
jgi:hypothetical protein